MKNIIRNIKYNRLPENRKKFIDFINKCEIMETTENIIFYHNKYKLSYDYKTGYTCITLELKALLKLYNDEEDYYRYIDFLNKIFKLYTKHNLNIEYLECIYEYEN